MVGKLKCYILMGSGLIVLGAGCSTANREAAFDVQSGTMASRLLASGHSPVAATEDLLLPGVSQDAYNQYRERNQLLIKRQTLVNNISQRLQLNEVNATVQLVDGMPVLSVNNFALYRPGRYDFNELIFESKEAAARVMELTSAIEYTADTAASAEALGWAAQVHLKLIGGADGMGHRPTGIYAPETMDIDVGIFDPRYYVIRNGRRISKSIKGQQRLTDEDLAFLRAYTAVRYIEDVVDDRFPIERITIELDLRSDIGQQHRDLDVAFSLYRPDES